MRKVKNLITPKPTVEHSDLKQELHFYGIDAYGDAHFIPIAALKSLEVKQLNLSEGPG